MQCDGKRSPEHLHANKGADGQCLRGVKVRYYIEMNTAPNMEYT